MMENTKVKKNRILDILDYNKNGKIDIEDIIVLAMRLPGVKVNRKDFLTKELVNVCDKKDFRFSYHHYSKNCGFN